MREETTAFFVIASVAIHDSAAAWIASSPSLALGVLAMTAEAAESCIASSPSLALGVLAMTAERPPPGSPPRSATAVPPDRKPP